MSQIERFQGAPTSPTVEAGPYEPTRHDHEPSLVHRITHPHHDSEDTYEQLVMWAFRASAITLLVKVVSVLFLANFFGGRIYLRFFFNVFPYFAIETRLGTFASIVTFSTVAMAAAAAAIVLWPLFTSRPICAQQIWGRAVGLGIALSTFFFEGLRDLLTPPVVRWGWSWLVGFQLIAGLAGLWILLKKSPNVADKHC